MNGESRPGGDRCGPLPTSAAAHDEVALQPDTPGHLAVETQSGDISCLVQTGWIGCETPSCNWQLHEDGSPYHSFKGFTDGSIEWADGQLGDMPRTKVDDRIFRALGWTIAPITDGLQFTCDATGHGFYATTRVVRGF
jgi:hypothetical protein